MASVIIVQIKFSLVFAVQKQAILILLLPSQMCYYQLIKLYLFIMFSFLLALQDKKLGYLS